MRRRRILITSLIAIPICLILGVILFLRSAYLLEKIRATLENRLERQLEQPLLFTVADANLHAPTLEDETLPEALRTAFRDYGVEFSSAVSVTFHDDSMEWIVSDKNHKWRYAVRRDENSFNVFKHRVSIGDLSGNIFTGLSLEHFEVSDMPSQPASAIAPPDRSLDRPIISAREMLVKYNLWRMLRGKLFITKLRFIYPEFNIRMNPDGRLNITELIPESDAASDAEFPLQFGIANIEFAGGSVRYEDGGRDLKIAVSGIHSLVEGPLDRWEHTGLLAMRDGSIELNDAETKIDEFETQFELLADAGELKKMHLATGNSRVTISGKVRDFAKPSRYLETKVDLDIDLRDFGNLLPERYEVAGNARLNLEAKGAAPDIAGDMRLELRAAAFNKFRLGELALNAEFNREAFKLTEVTGTYASGKLTAGLEATFGGLADSLFALVSASGATPPHAPTPTPSGEIADLTISNPSQDNPQSPFSYDGWVKLEGANVEEILPVIIDLPDDFLTVTGVLEGDVHISGSVPIDQQASLQDKNELKAKFADSLNLTGGFTIDAAAMNDVRIRMSEARFQLSENHLQVAANLDQATIQIDGAPGLKEPLNLDLAIQHIDADKLTTILRVPDLGGEGALHGKITADIPLSGYLKIPEGRLFDVPIGVLRADFLYRDGRVTLQPVRLTKGESALTLNGVAHIEGEIPVQFRVHAQPLQIADYVRLLAGADYPIEGVVTGDLILDGTLNALDGRGRLNVSNARAWELALDPLILPLNIEDYVVRISDFEVLAREQRGILNFQIDTALDYKLEFQSDPMRLKELAIARDIPDFLLDADLVVNATGEGNAADPRVDVNFNFSDITYDNHIIIPEGAGNRHTPEVRISGVFSEDALRFEGTGFEGSSQIRGILESTAGNPYQLFMRSNELNISPILALFHNSFEKMPATATGTLQLGGTLADLTQFTLDTRISILTLEVNGVPLTNAAPVRFGFSEDTWTVDSFSLAGADAKTADAAFVNCRLTLQDELIDFVAESRNFRLEPLCAALNLPANLTGRASYKLVGAGTLSEPEITLDWAIPELAIQTPIAPIRVNEASGRLAYANQTLTVEPLNFLLMDVPVNIKGAVAVEPAALQSSTLDLRLAIDNFDLASIESGALFRENAYRQFPIRLSPQGHLSCDAHLTGTFTDQSVNASIGVTDAKAEVLDLPAPFENINFEVRIIGGDGKSENLLTISTEGAGWQIGEGIYQANASWRLPRTQTQTKGDGRSSLLDLLASIAEGKSGETPIGYPEPAYQPSFQLQLDGKGINLTDFTGRSVKGQESLSISLQGGEEDRRPSSRTAPLIGNEQIADYLFNEKITRAAVDSRLELEGDGYSLRQIKAELTCDNLRVDLRDRRMLNVAPIRAALADGKFQIDSLQVGSPASGGNDINRKNGNSVTNSQADNRPSSAIATWVDIKGWIDLDGDLDFDVGLSDFPFGALLPGMTLPLFNTTVGVEAYLSGAIRLGGNVATPTITAEWEARGSIGDPLLPHFLEFLDTGRVEYRERIFTIHQTELSGYGNRLSIQGAIPIDLRLQPHDLKDRFLDRPVHLDIRSREADLSFLSRFQPQLETVGGIADVNLTIQGTTAAPRLYGAASLQNGMLKFANFDTPISDARIELRAQHGELRVPDFRFQIGEGSYALDVHCDMDGFFPRTVEVRSFHARQAQINDFARNLLPPKIAANLTGYMTAEARLIVPTDRFVAPGETAWFPKIVSPLTLHNLASHSKGGLKVDEIAINALDYEIRTLSPIECHLADGQLSVVDGFALQDRRLGISEEERFSVAVARGRWSVSGNDAAVTERGAPNTSHYLLDASLSNLDLAFVSDILPDGYAVDGALNSELRLRGTGENPELTCDWSASNLSINRADVDECGGTVAYRNGQLYIEEPVRFVIGSNRAEFTGSMPFDLSLDRLHAALPRADSEAPVNAIEGRLDVFIEDLEFLPLIQRQVGFAEGSGSVNVTIGGQINAPQLKGVANFANLGFDLPDANISVKNTNVTVDFTDKGFEIQRWEGVLNGGAYRADGNGLSDWHRLGYLDLTATLEKGAVFEDYGLYRVKCGDVNLTMKGPVGYGYGDVIGDLIPGEGSSVDHSDAVEALPPIQGAVHIIEGAYERHLQQLVNEWRNQGARIQFEAWSDYPIMRDLRFDLQILAPNDFWVISNLGELKIEVSIVGKLTGRIQKPSFDGRVDLRPTSEFTLEGIRYPFKIEDGSYVENTNPIEFNPRYEIYAETVDPVKRVQVIATDGETHTRDVQISVHLSGYLKQQEQKHRPQFYADVLRAGAGEEYDLSQAQIISILTTGDVTALERSPIGASLPFLLSPSQRYFGNRLAELIGVHEARVDLGAAGLEKPRFLLSREIFERLLITYSSTFQIHAEPRIEVEYQIKRGISVTGERSEQGKYGIDLKLEQRF